MSARPIRPIDDDFEEALHLARQLSSRLSGRMESEQAQGVRLRLARAHALSIVDLLDDIASDRNWTG